MTSCKVFITYTKHFAPIISINKELDWVFYKIKLLNIIIRYKNIKK